MNEKELLVKKSLEERMKELVETQMYAQYPQAHVKEVDDYNNFAEVQLEDSIEPYLFLRDIADKVKVSHFKVIEPTLNKIFIDMIKQSN